MILQAYNAKQFELSVLKIITHFWSHFSKKQNYVTEWNNIFRKIYFNLTSYKPMAAISLKKLHTNENDLHHYPSKHSSRWRRLEDVFRLRLQKTFSRRLQDFFIKTNILPYSYVFRSRLEHVLKTPWSRPIYSSWSCIFKTSSRRLQDVFKKFWRRL